MLLHSARDNARFIAGWVCASCRSQQSTKRALTARTFERISPATYGTRRYASNSPARPGGKVPDTPARTRFAPSPTGYMHIGGLRTALFSYLLAKRTEGQFLLRIEDTDQKRLVPDAEQRLCEDLNWAGLHWDEGPVVGGPYGPYKQSERNHIYQEYVQRLLEDGSAYRCFCTPQTTGSQGIKAAYVTSGCYQDCAALLAEEAQDRGETKHQAFTIRLKQPEDFHKRVYTDLIYGKIQRLKRSPSASQSAEDDSGIDVADTILVKSDGTPTYHFANVVDDHLMKITHVIRGTEWMASTPLHYDLYTAFGWTPPAFAHVGLLVDENKAKLSKRSNTGLVLDVRGMREQSGLLPEVLTNFLALLGWSNPGRNDVLEMQELIRDFDLKFTKGNTIVRMEKLWFLQKSHVARKVEEAKTSNNAGPMQEITDAVLKEVVPHSPFLQRQIGQDKLYPDLETYIHDILLIDSKSYQTPKQFVERNKYFFDYDRSLVPEVEGSYGEDAQGHGIMSDELVDIAQDMVSHSGTARTTASTPSALDANITSTSSCIHDCIHKALLHHMGDAEDADIAANGDLKKTYKAWNKALMRYLREKLSYGLPGPSIGQMMSVLGYEECCRRLGVEPTMEEGHGMGWGEYLTGEAVGMGRGIGQGVAADAVAIDLTP